VAESGRAHLGDGEAAGRDDECWGGEGGWACSTRASSGGGLGVDAEVARAGDGGDAGVGLDGDVGGGALVGEELDEVLGGAGAEELAEGLLVVGDAVLFYQGDHVRRGEGGEGGLGEVGVFGEEVLGAGVEVGEVGAAAAGDEDLLADAVGVVEEEDAFAAASGFCGAEEACGSGAEDDDVEAYLCKLFYLWRLRGDLHFSCKKKPCGLKTEARRWAGLLSSFAGVIIEALSLPDGPAARGAVTS
jgi:hypothetical protein